MVEVTESPVMSLHLNAVLDFAAAGNLLADLQASRGCDVTLIASDVQRVGAQCIQVLLSAQKTWAADEAVFRLTEPSAEFVEGASLLGAESLVFETSLETFS